MSPALSYMNGPTMYYRLSVSILTFRGEGNLLHNCYTYVIYRKFFLHFSTLMVWFVCVRDMNHIFLLQFIYLDTRKGVSGHIFLNTEFTFISILLFSRNTNVIDNFSSEY